MSAAADAWIRSEAQAALEAIEPGLLEDEQTRDVLTGFALAWATVRLALRQRALGLRTLRRPESIRADWLSMLGAGVGLTPDVPFVRRLDISTWRRVLGIAGSAWKTRATSYRDPLIAFVGTTPFVLYWHDGRWLLAEEDVEDEPTFPVSFFRATTAAARRKTLVLVPDAGGEYPSSGLPAVDRELVREVLDAFRPATQRIDLRFVDWVEDFIVYGAMRWRVSDGDTLGHQLGTLVVDESSGTATLSTIPPGGGVMLGDGYAFALHDPGAAGPLMRFAVVECWLSIGAEEGIVAVRFRTSPAGDSWRAVVIGAAVDPSDGGVLLVKPGGGPGSVLDAGPNDLEVHIGQRMHLQIASYDGGGGVDGYKVWLNGRLVLEATEPGSGAIVGSVAIATNAPTVVFGPVFQYQPRDGFDRIGPPGD